MRLSHAFLVLLALVPAGATAATYTVGPSGRQYTQLSAVFANNNLAPGDIVLVDGNATYGSVVIDGDDDGSAASPITVRWTRAAGQSRPLVSGGQHTVKFEQSDHVVFEGFDVTGGSSTCIFNEADGVVVRDVLVRDCPSHGILGADQNSGSFTLEFSEVRESGSGTTRHSIYMQNDQMVYPNAVFRMRFNYVHDGNGGILMRTRYSRSEIYYNWFEASTNEEVEFIGPDCEAQKAGWTADLVREDTDFVGNVIVHTSSWRNAIRTGGDLVGRNQGRVRIVGNTILFDSPSTAYANAVRVQLGVESVEMHNNVIHRTGSAVVRVLDENSDVAQPYPCSPQGTSPWTSGRKVAGTHNWVKAGSEAVPPEWTGTLTGADPLLASLAQRSLRPAANSLLVNAGVSAPATPAAFPFPSPLAMAAYDPPLRARLAPGSQDIRLPKTQTPDIGALEQQGIDQLQQPFLMNGSKPLVPGAGSSGQSATAAPDSRVRGAGPVVVERRRERQGQATGWRGWIAGRWHALLRFLGLRR